MGKDDSVYIYNGTLFNHVEWGNTPICNNIDTWGHYTMWNKSDRKTNTSRCHLYVEFFKKTELIEKEGRKVGEIRRC